MNVLITGGAGYVGSIVAEELLKQGYKAITLDNLQQGHKEAILPEAEFVLADICDAQALEDVFCRLKIDAVMHMAAETVVEYSMTDPRRYFQNNVVGGLSLLNTMLKHGVRRFIFSSSAAVYGEPQTTPIEEDHPKIPLNSYGESKLMFERILGWYGKAYGLKHISLRYFNAAGATELLGEDHRPETHLIPNVLKAALPQSSRFKVQGSKSRSEDIKHRTLNVEPVKIFGTDYPTKDGSCVRDYVHVGDIAKAHILALKKLDEVEQSYVLGSKSEKKRRTLNLEPRTKRQGWEARAYNLGNGEGYSVLEVVKTAKKVTDTDIPIKISPRRAGDPAVLVASSKRAKSELGWKPQFTELEGIIESAWKWMRKHPNGYRG